MVNKVKNKYIFKINLCNNSKKFYVVLLLMYIDFRNTLSDYLFLNSTTPIQKPVIHDLKISVI